MSPYVKSKVQFDPPPVLAEVCRQAGELGITLDFRNVDTGGWRMHECVLPPEIKLPPELVGSPENLNLYEEANGGFISYTRGR